MCCKTILLNVIEIFVFLILINCMQGFNLFYSVITILFINLKSKDIGEFWVYILHVTTQRCTH